MPGYNGVLTVSCIRALARIAERVSSSICLVRRIPLIVLFCHCQCSSCICQSCGATFLSLQDRICELIAPFRNIDKPWKVRIEASRVLLDLELHHKGLNAAVLLFLKYIDEEKSLQG